MTPEQDPQQSNSDLEEQFFENASEDEFKETPAPSSGRRPWWLAVIVIVICLYFMFALRADLFYFFVRSEPISIGNAIEFNGTDLPDNSYVSLEGIRNPSKGIRLGSWLSDKNVFQLMGTNDLFVETLVKDDVKSASLAEQIYAGRLVRFGNVSYFNTVRDFAAFNFGIDVSENAYVIKVTEKPEDMTYILGIYAILMVILFVNLFLFIRAIARR